MRPRFEHKESAHRAKRKPASRTALPNRGEFFLQIVMAELIEHQQVPALAIMRAADQHNVALAGIDARDRDAHGIDAGAFFAHESARRTGYAMHDGDIAAEKIW